MVCCRQSESSRILTGHDSAQRFPLVVLSERRAAVRRRAWTVDHLPQALWVTSLTTAFSYPLEGISSLLLAVAWCVFSKTGLAEPTGGSRQRFRKRPEPDERFTNFRHFSFRGAEINKQLGFTLLEENKENPMPLHFRDNSYFHKKMSAWDFLFFFLQSEQEFCEQTEGERCLKVGSRQPSGNKTPTESKTKSAFYCAFTWCVQAATTEYFLHICDVHFKCQLPKFDTLFKSAHFWWNLILA